MGTTTTMYQNGEFDCLNEDKINKLTVCEASTLEQFPQNDNVDLP